MIPLFVRARTQCVTILVLLTMLLNAGSSGTAQEARSAERHRCRVWIAPPSKASRLAGWYPPAIQVVSGNLVQFDCEGLRIQNQGDTSESAFSSSRVLWIELNVPNEASQTLIEHYVSGRFSEALVALPPALESRPPVWRQQLLTMIAANAGCRSQREKISLNLISQLDRRPLPAIVLGWAPIAWTGYPFGSSRRSANVAWVDPALTHLTGESPLASLVAASWLLSSSERPQAITQLKHLIKKKDRPSIAALAYCVLWTVATPPQVKSNRTKWLGQLEQLPMPLQMGPMLALERKLRAAGDHQVSEFLQSSINLTPISPHPLLVDRSR